MHMKILSSETVMWSSCHKIQPQTKTKQEKQSNFQESVTVSSHNWSLLAKNCQVILWLIMIANDK